MLFFKKKCILYVDKDTNDLCRGRIVRNVKNEDGVVISYLVRGWGGTELVPATSVLLFGDKFEDLYGLSSLVEALRREIQTLDEKIKSLSVTNAAALAAINLISEEKKNNPCKCKGDCHGKSHS